MATVSRIDLELANNYVEITTTYEAPKGEKGIIKNSNWSLKYSYFQRLYLSTSKPEEITEVEIINTITGNRIYITYTQLDEGIVSLNGEPIDSDGLINFLSKYTAYVVLPETSGTLLK